MGKLVLGGHMLRGIVSACGLFCLSAPAVAQDRLIAPEVSELRVVVNGQELVIARVGGDGDAICPPDCPQPMRAADGVQTLGAVEVLDFLQTKVAAGTGLLLDVRLPEAFSDGHLPGSVNVPGVTLRAENPSLPAIVSALGARDLVIYGAGPGSADAAGGVQGLLRAGVRAEQLRYFRGGMQEWLQFGLTVSGAQSGG